MSKEVFVPKKFRADSIAIIETANEILADYDAQGLVLTLRQLYYQFVARGILPNKQQEYKRLGSIISDARLAGLVDWALMEDRTRYLRKSAAWESPASIVEAVADQYQEDLWLTQSARAEVWIEKDALVGVIERPCEELRVPFFACRGYSSQSAQYEAGARFRRYIRAGQKPVVFHLGDHDPSGIDMTRDNTDRLSMFAREGVRFVRLALNKDQVDQYNPPPNPAKESDSRAAEYIREYGDESWELDALEPSVIGTLIRDAVGGLINTRRWDAAMQKETRNKMDIQRVSDRWDEVADFVRP